MDGKGKEHELLNSVLEDDEKVGIEITERRLGGARLLEPAHVFATNKRIIIIRRGIFGFHQDFKIINYSSITSVSLENGIMFSRMHFTLQGEGDDTSDKKWIVGLHYQDALNLMKFVNKLEEKPLAEKRRSLL